MAARQPIQIRLSTNGLTRLDQVAKDWDVTRSEVIRTILSNALSHPALLKRIQPRQDI